MECRDGDQQYLARLSVGRREDRVEVAQEERNREAEADADKDPVESRQRTPRDQRDGDPEQVRVPVQRPALQQVCTLGPKVAQRQEQQHGHHQGVAVDETCGACYLRDLSVSKTVYAYEQYDVR